MFDFNVARINNTKLSNSLKRSKTELNPKTELNAMYTGIVEDTNDPRGMGRIKVRIPALHGTNPSQSYYLPTKQIPWATPACLTGGSNDMGQYIVPTKGCQVMVSFQCNSFSYPVYFGTLPSQTNGIAKNYNDNSSIFGGENIEILSDDRIKDLNNSSSTAVKSSNKTLRDKNTTGKTVVYKSLKGATIMIDDEDGAENIQFMDASGQTLILGNNSGSTLPRRGSSTTPSKNAKTYMALSNNQGDEVYITKGKVIIKTGNGETINLDKGKIQILNSNKDTISMENGKLNMKTSSGKELSLSENNINIKSNDSSILLEDNKINMSNGASTFKLDGNNVSMSNGQGTMSISGSVLYSNGHRVWDDTYHPGV